MRKQRPKFFYGWLVVIAAVAAGAMQSGGGVWGASVFASHMTEELGWARSAFFGAFTLRAVMGGALSPFIGPLQDTKTGPRVLMFLGGITLGLSLIGLKWVDNIAVFYLLFGALGALSMLSGAEMLTVAIVPKWFVRRRGRAVAIASTGTAMGPLFFPFLVHGIISLVGWRDAWMALGIGTLVIMTPLALLVRSRPEDMGLLPDGATEPTDPATLRQAQGERRGAAQGEPTDPATLRQAQGERRGAAQGERADAAALRQAQGERADAAQGEPTDAAALRQAQGERRGAAQGERADAAALRQAQGERRGAAQGERADAAALRQAQGERADAAALRQAQGERGDAAQGERAGAAAQGELSYNRSQAVRTYAFWLLILAFFLAMLGMGGFHANWIPYFEDIGFSPAVGAWAATAYGVCSISVRLVWGVLAERFPVRYLMVAQALLTAVSIVLFLNITNITTLIIAGAGHGLSLGGFFIMRPLMVANYFGRQHLGAINGILRPFVTLSGAMSPLLVAGMFDVFGSYREAFILVTLTWVFAAGVVFLAAPPKRLRVPAQAAV